MANKNQIDYDSLTPEQKKVAQQVYLAAEKYGLNPDFVLPLAYAESGFIQKARSERGAQGVMQISEDAAKRYKCDPTDLADNIDCGMRIIKSHIDNPKIGNDPYKVVIAYNTRSDTLNKFLDAYNSDPENPEKHMHLLPEATKKHIANIEDYFGGGLPNVGVGETAKDAETTAGTEPPKVDTSNDFKEDKKKVIDTSADDAEKKRNAERLMGAGMGALAGTGLGTAAAGVQGVADVGSAVLSAIRNQAVSTPAQTTTTAPTTETPYEIAKRAVEESSGTTKVAPTGGTTTPSSPNSKYTAKFGENVGLTNKEIASATGMGKGEGEAWDIIKKARETTNKINKSFPGNWVFDPERQMMIDTSAGAGPRGTNRQPLTLAPSAEEQAAKNAFWAKHHADVDRLNKTQQAVQQAPKVAPVAQAATADSFPVLSKIMKGASYLKYPVLGGLTGLGIGYGAADTYGRYKEGDKKGAALSGAGTALGAVAPFIGGLAGLSTGAAGAAIPLYLYANDRLEHLKRHPEDYQLAPNDYDAMGNPLQ
jgi:hypothetical protein